MLVTKLKKEEEVTKLLPKRIFVIYCLGCAEVSFPLHKARELVKRLKAAGFEVVAEQLLDYECRQDFTQKRLEMYGPDLEKADAILNFSCGVGTQQLADLAGKPVFTGCDTIKLAGYAGLTPSELECDRCGECVIGFTGGYCPVANCAKSLVNGPCGGAKAGKCEIDSDKDCAWLKICERLKAQGRLDVMKKIESFRDYSKYELKVTSKTEE